jgi:hypothetical protein
MSTTTVDMAMRMNVSEKFTAVEVPSARSEQQRTLSAGAATETTGQLGPTTVPKVDKPPIALEISGAGTTTINLTSVAGLSVPPGTRTLDMTGAKLKGFQFKAPKTNTGTVNVAPGGANPYPFLGTGNDIDLGPGEGIGDSFDGVESPKPAVSGTVKNIDVTIAGSDKLEVLMLFGT